MSYDRACIVVEMYISIIFAFPSCRKMRLVSCPNMSDGWMLF